MGVGEDDRVREQRDIAWDALREIEVIVRSESEDWSKLDGIGAIISNGPLDTAPGGPREDECARLRGEVERLQERERELGDALRAIAESPWTSVRESERGLAVLSRRPVPFGEQEDNR